MSPTFVAASRTSELSGTGGCGKRRRDPKSGYDPRRRASKSESSFKEKHFGGDSASEGGLLLNIIRGEERRCKRRSKKIQCRNFRR